MAGAEAGLGDTTLRSDAFGRGDEQIGERLTDADPCPPALPGRPDQAFGFGSTA